MQILAMVAMGLVCVIAGFSIAVIFIFLTEVRHYRWIIWDSMKGVWCRWVGHRSKDSVVCERCYQALEVNDTGNLAAEQSDEIAVPRLYEARWTSPMVVTLRGVGNCE